MSTVAETVVWLRAALADGETPVRIATLTNS
jgi:hypothetical protein